MQDGHSSGSRHYEGEDLQSHLLGHQCAAIVRGDVRAGKLLSDGEADWMLGAIHTGCVRPN